MSRIFKGSGIPHMYKRCKLPLQGHSQAAGDEGEQQGTTSLQARSCKPRSSGTAQSAITCEGGSHGALAVAFLELLVHPLDHHGLVRAREALLAVQPLDGQGGLLVRAHGHDAAALHARAAAGQLDVLVGQVRLGVVSRTLAQVLGGGRLAYACMPNHGVSWLYPGAGKAQAKVQAVCRRTAGWRSNRRCLPALVM